MIAYSPGQCGNTAPLDDLLWHPTGVPNHVQVHYTTTANLATLGWQTTGDPTGGYGLLQRVVAHRFDVCFHQVVLQPARGGADPKRARGAYATLTSVHQHIPGTPVRIWTSLSRSEPMIVVATALTPVGVDVEVLQSQPQATALACLLHRRDQQTYKTISGNQYVVEVTAAWTRKEALLKATGTGLRHEPSSQAVGTQSAPKQPGGWASHSAPIAGGSYLLGVAWQITAADER